MATEPSTKPSGDGERVQYEQRLHDGLIPSDEAKVYPEVAYAPPVQEKAAWTTASVTSPSPSQAHTYSNSAQWATVPQAQLGGNPWDGQATGTFHPQAPLPPLPNERRPWWRRPLTWVIVAALIIVVVMAGIIGGIASGAIKVGQNGNSSAPQSTNTAGAENAGTSSSAPPPTTTPTPSTTEPSSASSTSSSVRATFTPTFITTPDGVNVTVSCPSADGTRYTASTSSQTVPKIFDIKCSSNYAFGDGELGLHPDTVTSLADCIELCATSARTCVGVVFNRGPQCWLKEFIGVRTNEIGTESAIWIQ